MKNIRRTEKPPAFSYENAGGFGIDFFNIRRTGRRNIRIRGLNEEVLTTEFLRILVPWKEKKGKIAEKIEGDSPSAGSPTDTLLRLKPSQWFYHGPQYYFGGFQ